MTPRPDPQSTRSQRWPARLSFVLAGLAIAILVVFVGLKSLAMLGLALASSAVVSLAAAYIFLSRDVTALAAAHGLHPRADRRHRRLRLPEPAEGGHRVRRGLAARERDCTPGAGRGRTDWGMPEHPAEATEERHESHQQVVRESASAQYPSMIQHPVDR